MQSVRYFYNSTELHGWFSMSSPWSVVVKSIQLNRIAKGHTKFIPKAYLHKIE